MLNHSNTRNAQANQPQELIPLTPEVAREIERLLIKNSEALERLKDRHNAGRGTKDFQRNLVTVKGSNA
jgi:hypothetical protein